MFLTTFCASISTAATLLFGTTAFAADLLQQKPGESTVKDFRFHTGEVLPELKLHYVTIGEPTGAPVLVPMASQPTAMSGRNWVLRRMLIDAIKADPAWNNGNYTEQPSTFKYAATIFSFATAGGTQSFFRRAPTRELADKLVEQRLAEK